MPLKTYFSDDFSSGTLLTITSGNGTIAAGGGLLKFNADTGVDCDWWYTIGSPWRRGKYAYSALPSTSGKKGISCEVTFFGQETENSDRSMMVASIEAAANNAYWIYAQRDGYIRVHTNLPGSATYLGEVYLPLPARVRFWWDIVRSVMFFEYWTGSAWEKIVDCRACEFTPTVFGLGGKNWDTKPGFACWWDDYLVAYETEEKRLTPYEPTPGTQANIVGKPREAPEDRTTLISMFHRAVDPCIAPNEAMKVGVDLLGGGMVDSSGGKPSLEDDRTGRRVLNPGRKRLPFQADAAPPCSQLWLEGKPEDLGGASGAGGSLRIAGNARVGVLEDSYGKNFDTWDLLDPSEFRTNTYDPESHVHFSGVGARQVFFYDTTGEPWAAPTSNNWNGYARDGWLYTNGVKQGTRAPWALEAPSSHRSSRSEFPTRVAIVVNWTEIVIFDLDYYPASLRVWMRFQLGDASNFYLLGRISGSVNRAMMVNGVLAACSVHNGTDNGGLFLVNFASTDQNFVHLVRNDNHWFGVSGRNITHRNMTGNHTSTGPSPSLRLRSTNLYHVSLRYFGSGVYYVGLGGNNPAEIVCYYPSSGGASGNKPQWQTAASGGLEGSDGAGMRVAFFDDHGWLWWSNGYGRLFYDFGDFRQFRIDANPMNKRVRYIDLYGASKEIRDLVQVGDRLYAAVPGHGVYIIRRDTFASWLGYTAVGGGGRGRDNVAGAGEVLPGELKAGAPWNLERCNLYLTGFISVGTNPAGGSYTLIRTFDDYIQRAMVRADGLPEPGARCTAVWAR